MIDRLESWTAALLDWAATPWRQTLIITLVALGVILPGLASLPVTDRDEARFAQASKQMLETGDLIDIRFQDKPRWKKPVGIYWLQAASASVFGGVEAPIWAYRLPSALAGLLAALLTAWAARPLIEPRGALLAGVMMASTLLLAAEAHIAKTDAALCATAAAALGALAHLVFGRGGLGTALVFWLAIAASVLLKGPIVPVIAAFAIAALAFRSDTRPMLARLRWGIGLTLTVLIVAPWLIAIWDVSDGGFFAESLGKDMGGKLAEGQEKHWGPPGLYLGLVWLTLWPWAAALPGAAASLWRHRRTDWVIFLLAWVVPFWIVLEAVPTKLPHYVLPLYPVLVIGIAYWLTSDRLQPSRLLRRVGAALTAIPPLIVCLGLVAGAVFIAWQGSWMKSPPLDNTSAPWAAAILALAAAAIAILAARAILRTRLLAYASGALVSALLLYAALLQFGLPRLGYVFPSPAMAQTLAQYRPCASGPAFSVGYHEPSLVFLTETGIRMADPKGAMEALATDPGAMVLITARWEKILKTIPPSVPRATFRYFNYNRGKPEIATLLTQDDARWDACRLAGGSG